MDIIVGCSLMLKINGKNLLINYLTLFSRFLNKNITD